LFCQIGPLIPRSFYWEELKKEAARRTDYGNRAKELSRPWQGMTGWFRLPLCLFLVSAFQFEPFSELIGERPSKVRGLLFVFACCSKIYTLFYTFGR
jgi:hypothetical protein